MCVNPDIIAILKEHIYLKQHSIDKSTIRSWNIKRWLIQHITKYLTTNLHYNVYWSTKMNNVIRYKYYTIPNKTLRVVNINMMDPK